MAIDEQQADQLSAAVARPDAWVKAQELQATKLHHTHPAAPPTKAQLLSQIQKQKASILSDAKQQAYIAHQQASLPIHGEKDFLPDGFVNHVEIFCMSAALTIWVLKLYKRTISKKFLPKASTWYQKIRNYTFPIVDQEECRLDALAPIEGKLGPRYRITVSVPQEISGVRNAERVFYTLQRSDLGKAARAQWDAQLPPISTSDNPAEPVDTYLITKRRLRSITVLQNRFWLAMGAIGLKGKASVTRIINSRPVVSIELDFTRKPERRIRDEVREWHEICIVRQARYAQQQADRAATEEWNRDQRVAEDMLSRRNAQNDNYQRELSALRGHAVPEHKFTDNPQAFCDGAGMTKKPHMPGDWQDNLILNARREDIREIVPPKPKLSADQQMANQMAAYYNPPVSGMPQAHRDSYGYYAIASGMVHQSTAQRAVGGVEVIIDRANNRLVRINIRGDNGTERCMYQFPGPIAHSALEYLNRDSIEAINVERDMNEIRTMGNLDAFPITAVNRERYRVRLKTGEEFITWP